MQRFGVEGSLGYSTDDDRWGEVSSYTTVDLISRYELSKQDTLTLGIENLFNRDYYPQYSQLMRNSLNSSRLPAADTVLTAMYSHRW